VGFLVLLPLLFADDPAESLAKKMLPIYRQEIAEYSLAVESAPKKELELKKEPVFEWSNPVGQGLHQGVIFLWLRDGQPAALGGIFSHPVPGWKGRKVLHEFLALDRDKLLVRRPSGALNEWKPQAGLARKELPDAGTPAATRGARLVQLRQLAQQFTGHSSDNERERWEPQLDLWERETRNAFLGAYDEVARGSGLYGSLTEVMPLLRLFELECASADLQRALFHRPDWADVPLRALAALAG